MNELASRRGKAYARDCVRYALIAAGTVPLGLVANAAGWGRKRSFVLAASAIPPVLATLVAAGQESGESGATAGKRRYGLRVTDRDYAPVGFGRALVRNVLKIGLPWQIGHTMAVGAAFGGFDEGDPLTVSAAVVTYPLLGVMIAAVLRGEGRAVHDRLAGTRVSAVG